MRLRCKDRFLQDVTEKKRSESLTIAGQTYTTATGYNARGELTKYTYPDSTVVDRTYTARGELYQLKHAGTTIDTRAYDNGGRMSSSTLNNGVIDTRSYGTDNSVSSITFTGSGTSIGNLSYGWDNNHNKTSETITGTMSNYGFSIPTGGYDGEDRLVSFNRTSGLSQSWNLSPVGDWNSVTTNGTAQTRTHGPTHELLSGAGSNVSTDVQGNITLIPSSLRPTASSLTSTWDFENRLTSATTGSNTVSHQYDALGRRVARTSGSSTTIYVQAGQQTIADYASGAAPASSTYRYVYAGYIDEPVMRWTTYSSTAVYYHRNQQYSVAALTNSSGAVLERYAYTAYGDPIVLSDTECMGVMGANPRAQQALLSALSTCSNQSGVTGTIGTSETLEAPWKTSLGGVVSSLTYSCECYCMRWNYSVSDTYDWKSILREWSTHRTIFGHAVTLAFDLAQTLTACRATGDWKEFPISGSCFGGNCP